MTTQPDDKSTWITRSIGKVTGSLGSFPAIVFAVVLVAGSLSHIPVDDLLDGVLKRDRLPSRLVRLDVLQNVDEALIDSLAR